MSVVKSRNHVTTPAHVVALSLAGFVATVPEPEDKRAALATHCPRCGKRGLRVRAYENPAGRYRLLLDCQGCRRFCEEA